MNGNYFPLFNRFDNSIFQMINRFKSFIAEILYGSFLTAVACLFAEDSSVRFLFISVALSILAINMLANTTREFLRSRLLNTYGSHLRSFKNRSLVVICQICKTLASFNLALLFGVTGAVLIHEGGHLALVSLIFKQADPHVTMVGLLEASTDWTIHQYTAFGAWLGPVKAGLFIAGAGAFAAMCFGTIGILISQKIKKNYAKLSNCIFFASVFSILTQVNYAFTAFFADSDDLGHDFMNLWQGGIHPVTAIVFLIAIPALALFVYHCYRAFRRRLEKTP